MLDGAINEVLGEYDELIERYQEMKNIVARNILPSPDFYDSLTTDEKLEMRKFASDLDVFRKIPQKKKQFESVLLGQYYFVTRFDREEIISELKDFPSERKVDILTCWGWIKSHHERLTDRDNKRYKAYQENPYKPYQCKVGPAFAPGKPRTRHTVDREFFVVRSFLFSYNAQVNSDFCFLEKRERPDFLFKNSRGDVIGFEITDAHADEMWVVNHGKEVNILDELHEKFGITHIMLTGACNPAPNWESHLDSVYNFFRNDIKPFYESCSNVRKQWNLFGIIVDVQSGAYINITNDDENRPYGGDAFERNCSELIKDKVHAKLQGTNPEFRPCILVIQPVHELPAGDHNLVLDMVKKKLEGISFNSKYDEIWYSYNELAFRILPETNPSN
jgi:hypothetical protein